MTIEFRNIAAGKMAFTNHHANRGSLGQRLVKCGGHITHLGKSIFRVKSSLCLLCGFLASTVAEHRKISPSSYA